MSTLTLQSLLVQGFRSFEHLSIDRLGRVNLFVGKNSVGKTSLLEALWLYSDGGTTQRLRELLVMRDELGYSVEAGERGMEILRYFFYGRPEIGTSEMSANIGEVTDPDKRVHFSLHFPYTAAADEKISANEMGINDERELVGGEDDGPLLISKFGKDISRRIPAGTVNAIFSHERNRIASRPTLFPSSFITANGRGRPRIGHLWDKIALTDREDVVLAALRIVVPDVERISIVNNAYAEAGEKIERIPIVKLKGARDPVPLRSLGEGLYRLFALALSLVDAAGGFFLVDEIESGLHYSVQVDLWRIIFAVARQLDIQVFATTHSFDCIEAFQVAAQEDEASEGMLIRLERKNGEIIPTLFDERRLGIVTREHIEVR